MTGQTGPDSVQPEGDTEESVMVVLGPAGRVKIPRLSDWWYRYGNILLIWVCLRMFSILWCPSVISSKYKLQMWIILCVCVCVCVCVWWSDVCVFVCSKEAVELQTLVPWDEKSSFFPPCLPPSFDLHHPITHAHSHAHAHTHTHAPAQQFHAAVTPEAIQYGHSISVPFTFIEL